MQSTNTNPPIAKLPNTRGIKHQHRIQDYLAEHHPTYNVKGVHLQPTEKQKLRGIGITARKWTEIISNKSLLSLDMMVDLKILFDAPSIDILVFKPDRATKK